MSIAGALASPRYVSHEDDDWSSELSALDVKAPLYSPRRLGGPYARPSGVGTVSPMSLPPLIISPKYIENFVHEYEPCQKSDMQGEKCDMHQSRPILAFATCQLSTPDGRSRC